MKQVFASVGVVVAGVVLVVGLAIGGWNLYWWMAGASTNNTAHIYHNSYGAQSADTQQVQNLAAQVATIDTQIADPTTPATEVSALQAQKSAIIRQACSLAANIVSLTPDVSQFVSLNCG